MGEKGWGVASTSDTIAPTGAQPDGDDIRMHTTSKPDGMPLAWEGPLETTLVALAGPGPPLAGAWRRYAVDTRASLALARCRIRRSLRRGWPGVRGGRDPRLRREARTQGCSGSTWTAPCSSPTPVTGGSRCSQHAPRRRRDHRPGPDAPGLGRVQPERVAERLGARLRSGPPPVARGEVRGGLAPGRGG